MTRDEAIKRTYEGMWNNITTYIKDRITLACGEGEFETRVSRDMLLDIDKERLTKLGYTIELDNNDMFFPEYIISWWHMC